MFQHALDRFALLLKGIEVGPEHLHRQRAFQAGLGFIHGIFGRLGVIEDDAGEGLQLLVDRLRSGRLVAIGAMPFAIRLEADIEFDIEKAGGVGAVIGAAQLGSDEGDLRE